MHHHKTIAMWRCAKSAGAALSMTLGVLLGPCAAGFCRMASCSFALLFVLVMASVSVAQAEDRIAPRQNLPLPHIVLFTDYFLFSAQRDVTAMTNAEQAALVVLLDTCPDTLTASETLHLKCDLARYRYLMNYRQDRHIYHLLDAIQFMTSQFRYNQKIGRGNQIGIEGRLGVIRAGLGSALRFVAVRAD